MPNHYDDIDWSTYQFDPDEFEDAGFQDIYVDPFASQWEDLGFLNVEGFDADAFMNSWMSSEFGAFEWETGQVGVEDILGMGGSPGGDFDIEGMVTAFIDTLGADAIAQIEANLGDMDLTGYLSSITNTLFSGAGGDINDIVNDSMTDVIMGIASQEDSPLWHLVADYDCPDPPCAGPPDLLQHLNDLVSGNMLSSDDYDDIMAQVNEQVMPEIMNHISATFSDFMAGGVPGDVLGTTVNPYLLQQQYGDVYRDIDDMQRTLAIHQTENEWNKMTGEFDSWATNELKNLTLKEEDFKTRVEYGVADAEREIEMAGMKHKMAKNQLISDAVREVDSISNKIGQSGVTTATTAKDLVLDNVESKVNAANASHSIARAQTKQGIDALQNKFGEEGTELDILGLTFDSQYDTKLTGLGNKFSIMNNQLNMTVASIYDDWMTSQYNLAGQIFSYSPGWG